MAHCAVIFAIAQLSCLVLALLSVHYRICAIARYVQIHDLLTNLQNIKTERWVEDMFRNQTARGRDAKFGRKLKYSNSPKFFKGSTVTRFLFGRLFRWIFIILEVEVYLLYEQERASGKQISGWSKTPSLTADGQRLLSSLPNKHAQVLRHSLLSAEIWLSFVDKQIACFYVWTCISAASMLEGTVSQKSRSPISGLKELDSVSSHKYLLKCTIVLLDRSWTWTWI